MGSEMVCIEIAGVTKHVGQVTVIQVGLQSPRSLRVGETKYDRITDSALASEELKGAVALADRAKSPKEPILVLYINSTEAHVFCPKQENS